MRALHVLKGRTAASFGGFRLQSVLSWTFQGHVFACNATQRCRKEGAFTSRLFAMLSMAAVIAVQRSHASLTLHKPRAACCIFVSKAEP